MVLLTFLDPVCTSDCPLIAQEFRQADQMLGGSRTASNWSRSWPTRSTGPSSTPGRSTSQERLTALRNWLFLTGTLAQLQQAWKNYAVAAEVPRPAG